MKRRILLRTAMAMLDAASDGCTLLAAAVKPFQPR
jgi:hypothetical protein